MLQTALVLVAALAAAAPQGTAKVPVPVAREAFQPAPPVRVPPGERRPEALGGGRDVAVPPPSPAPRTPDRPAADGVPAMSLHR